MSAVFHRFEHLADGGRHYRGYAPKWDQLTGFLLLTPKTY